MSYTPTTSLFESDSNEGLVAKKELKNGFIGYVIDIYHPHIDSIGKLVLECQSKLLLKNLPKKAHENDEIASYDTSGGFLIGEWSLDTLKKLLSSPTSLLLCIIDGKRNRLAGYQLLTPITNFSLIAQADPGLLELDHSVISEEHWKEFISSYDVRYSEQTGVAIEYRSLGIGSSLIDLAKSHSSQGICTDVIVWPYENVASVNYRVKNGFQAVGFLNLTASEIPLPYKSKIFIWPPVDSRRQSNGIITSFQHPHLAPIDRV